MHLHSLAISRSISQNFAGSTSISFALWPSRSRFLDILQATPPPFPSFSYNYLNKDIAYNGLLLLSF
ncbi:hypothetical protein I3760_03G108400 [Carya illinoinensis]|nr:hypothetical protein I3760_03G108400 [Carya illinoinensis]